MEPIVQVLNIEWNWLRFHGFHAKGKAAFRVGLKIDKPESKFLIINPGPTNLYLGSRVCTTRDVFINYKHEFVDHAHHSKVVKITLITFVADIQT